MYVCLHRDSDGDVYLCKFDTLEEAQQHLIDEGSSDVKSIGSIDDGEQVNGTNEETLAIVFKATDLIVETQRVTLREPVTLE